MYYWENSIGAGIQGTVYLVRHSKTNKRYIAKPMSTDGQITSASVREMVYGSFVNHPNLNRLSDVITTRDGIFAIYPFHPNSLSNYIDSNHHANMTTRRNLFDGIHSAVMYLHRHGLAHMDISHENVLLTNSGKPVLIDYGSIIPINCPNSYKYGIKDAYRPPDNILFSENPISIDYWALGILYLYIMTGRLVFQPNKKVIHSLCSIEKVPNFDVNIILQMLNPNPDDRETYWDPTISTTPNSQKPNEMSRMYYESYIKDNKLSADETIMELNTLVASRHIIYGDDSDLRSIALITQCLYSNQMVSIDYDSVGKLLRIINDVGKNCYQIKHFLHLRDEIEERGCSNEILEATNYGIDNYLPLEMVPESLDDAEMYSNAELLKWLHCIATNDSNTYLSILTKRIGS